MALVSCGRGCLSLCRGLGDSIVNAMNVLWLLLCYCILQDRREFSLIGRELIYGDDVILVPAV